MGEMPLKITLLSDARSWKNSEITGLAERLEAKGHQVRWLHEASKVPASDILFILGFWAIVPNSVLQKNRINLVVHESALPKGRGWSPVSWQVLEGKKSIPLTLFEAVERVDAGVVFLRSQVPLKGDELLQEIQAKVARELVALCERFVRAFPGILKRGKPQKGKPTYYRRRTAVDSELDVRQSIAKQFDLLRIVDNESYPAFFRHRGHVYKLRIEKDARRP